MLIEYDKENNQSQYIETDRTDESVFESKSELQYKEIDLTTIINEFVMYNSYIELKNSEKCKQFWIDIVNKNTNNNIQFNERLNITWKIILEDVSIYKNENLVIDVKNGKINVI